MDVTKRFLAFFRNARDKLETGNNVVYLSEADLVCNEPGQAALRPPQGNPWTKSSIETDADNLATTSASWEASASLLTTSAAVDFEDDKTLGQLLTETRERRGISREQVTKEIHVPAYYVRMIESGTYDAVPDELYLVPFIRRYASFLGLDPQQAVSRFIQDFEKAQADLDVETSAQVSKDEKTVRISLFALAALFGALILSYIGSKIGSGAATVAHPAAIPSAAAIGHDNRINGSSTISPSKAEAAGASTLTIQAPVNKPVALAESAPVASSTINQQTTANHRRRNRGHRLNHRRGHQSP